MKYFAFVDRYDLLPIISSIAEGADEMIVVKIGVKGGGQPFSYSRRLFEWKELYLDEVDKLAIRSSDRVIIGATEYSLFSRLVHHLSSSENCPPILVLCEYEISGEVFRQGNVSVVDLPTLARKHLSGEWRVIDTRRKVFRIRDILQNAGKILIMTQNDPDPDAIACGLAVQTILGRDRETAPICTFGQVTRNENVAMIKTLRTEVRTITRADVAGFDKVVMVDVQPPYFEKGLFERADVVIDHHPYEGYYEAGFRDINVSYGATSTMLYEYLVAGKVNISMRLATALLYGIITDTMYLARDTSRRDFEAFSALWPLCNTQMLASMSRPRLDPQELSYFVRAINNRRVVGDFVFMWLGTIDREDIIPRLADFSLQIGDSSWSAVAGIYEDELIISMRNIGIASDAGELASSLFSKWGSAGGHQSMAKAVVNLESFRKSHSLKSMKQVGEKLLRMFSEALDIRT